MLQAVMTNPGNVEVRDYSEFTRFTYPYAIARFAAMGRIFQSDLRDVSEEEAAVCSCEALDEFLKSIDM